MQRLFVNWEPRDCRTALYPSYGIITHSRSWMETYKDTKRRPRSHFQRQAWGRYISGDLVRFSILLQFLVSIYTLFDLLFDIKGRLDQRYKLTTGWVVEMSPMSSWNKYLSKDLRRLSFIDLSVLCRLWCFNPLVFCLWIFNKRKRNN